MTIVNGDLEMADVHDKATRSYNMSRIKGKDTRPEMIVRKFLYCKGFRYQLHDKRLPGKPDISMAKYATAIFVHGCFWHGHKNCRYFVIPRTRMKWWMKKIEENQQRDLENTYLLKSLGWKVITIFECELKGFKQSATLEKLYRKLSAE